MSFNEQLIITIVDKLAIGLLILFAGLLINRFLERYKSMQAFENEIAKQRVTKISDIWSSLYEWESFVRGMIRRVAEIQLEFGRDRDLLREKMEAEVLPSMEISESKSKNIPVLVEQNRFWLGEELYTHFREYYNDIMKYMEIYADGRYEEFKALDEKIEKSKHNVVKVLRLVK